MSNQKKHVEQRHKRPLLFPVRFFRELVRSIKYIVKSTTLSMRRKIAFDFGVLFCIVSILTLLIFSVGFMLYEAKIEADEAIDLVYELVSIKEKGFYDIEELQRQSNEVSEDLNIGIYVEMNPVKGNQEEYTVAATEIDGISNNLFDMNLLLKVKAFFVDGHIINTEYRTFTLDDQNVVEYKIVVALDFWQSGSELWFLLTVLFISQVVGLTVVSFVSSYRLRRVFRPVYTMTRAAEKISINDMNAKLDVSKAEYELKDLALTFNDMLERIRKDYDKQKRFVSDVSHELRTPISIVNGYARMLDRWGKADEAILEESIDAIKGESKNMQILVENLLTLVRSDNQSLIFEKEEFLLDELCQEIIKDMEMVDDGRHNFSHEIEAGISVTLDYSKIKQTIRIFLDNAIKYTPDNGLITLKVYKDYENVVIAVSDTGIGVSKDDLPYLFDRFYRSDESRTRETGGHGLGLSIAKAMVIGQKGRLKVKSKESEGSEFVIILPQVNL